MCGARMAGGSNVGVGRGKMNGEVVLGARVPAPGTLAGVRGDAQGVVAMIEALVDGVGDTDEALAVGR